MGEAPHYPKRSDSYHGFAIKTILGHRMDLGKRRMGPEGARVSSHLVVRTQSKQQFSITNNMKRHISILGLFVCLGLTTVMTGITGCAGSRSQRSTGESIDDTATTGRVKAALHGDSQYKYPDVEVHTFKGLTQLSGFVASGEQKSRASSIAKGVEGVRSVENNITIKP
jgi:hyperosmotically inducible protein